MENNIISIILPMYNAEKVIKRTLESLLNQKYENYEIIIVDDGSIDESGKICEEYSNRYKRIRYYKTENKGVSHARNYGISKANGNYIMFIDSDDEYMFNTLEEVNSELYIYDLITFGYERIDVNKQNKTRIVKLNNIISTNKQDKKQFIEKLQNNFLYNQVWNKVFKKEIIINNNVKFDENISLGEDYKFNIEYIKNAKKIKNLDKVLYKYYIYSDGLTMKEKEKTLYVKLDSMKAQKDFYIEENYNLNYVDKIFINTCFSGLTMMINNNKQDKKNIEKYINNKKIHEELEEIKKRQKSIKYKFFIRILNIKNTFILTYISRILVGIRRIYRKIRIE